MFQQTQTPPIQSSNGFRFRRIPNSQRPSGYQSPQLVFPHSKTNSLEFQPSRHSLCPSMKSSPGPAPYGGNGDHQQVRPMNLLVAVCTEIGLINLAVHHRVPRAKLTPPLHCRHGKGDSQLRLCYEQLVMPETKETKTRENCWSIDAASSPGSDLLLLSAREGLPHQDLVRRVIAASCPSGRRARQGGGLFVSRHRDSRLQKLPTILMSVLKWTMGLHTHTLLHL
jgi:hypothetical protein